MGLGLFLAKYGPGSPGSIARAMCRSYIAIRRRSPDLSEQDVLRKLYESRVRAAVTWNRAAQFGYSLESEHVDQILHDWGRSLGGLVQYVARQEHPVLGSAEHAFRSIPVMDMLLEVVSKKVPDWQSRRLG